MPDNIIEIQIGHNYLWLSHLQTTLTQTMLNDQTERKIVSIALFFSFLVLFWFCYFALFCFVLLFLLTEVDVREFQCF